VAKRLNYLDFQLRTPIWDRGRGDGAPAKPSTGRPAWRPGAEACTPRWPNSRWGIRTY